MIEFKDMLSKIEGFPDQQRLEVFATFSKVK
jgi:hypothetical protein